MKGKGNVKWGLVAVFAVAMAWMEASVVMYLRFFLDRVNPYQANPLPVSLDIGWIEPCREVATLVMLVCVGWLAGRVWSARVGYFLLAFGVWDIAYYFFLHLMGGWPTSIFDWDVLFLLPLPWWGPVAAPILIASLMILFGTSIAGMGESDQKIRLRSHEWIAGVSGTMLALLVFMWDGIRTASHGLEAISNTLPESFMWVPFLMATFLMSIPIAGVYMRQARERMQAARSK